MKRFMLYVFAQDGADVDGALVTVGKNLAQLWLKFRGAFWATKSICGDRLCSLTLCDFTPDFFSGPPEDFEDEVLNLLDSLCIEVPEDIGFPEEERFVYRMPKPRVAVFGGSFNPPHFAHMAVVFWLLGARLADYVWIIPCWRHMFGKRLAPFKHRFSMCQMAFSVFNNCSVLDTEKKLGGPSLTLRTIQTLKKTYPDFDISLVIGYDNWLVRDKWEGFEQLEKECGIIVVEENAPIPVIRSTAIRKKIKACEDISNMAPKCVADTIIKHGLYGYKRR